jgi:hypothetical protein
MMVFMFVSSLVGASNFNGWLNVQRAKVRCIVRRQLQRMQSAGPH